MTNANPSILVVGYHSEAWAFARRVLDWLQPGCAVDLAMPDKRIDAVSASLIEAECRQRLEKREYSLALIWLPDSMAAEEVEATRKIAAADPSLPIILTSTNSPGLLSEAVAEFISVAQIFVARRDGAMTMVRHWLAAQSERRDALEQVEQLRAECAKWRSQLSQARREVQQATRVKAEFLANVSHEIRTPMNSILGFSGLLLREPLHHEQREKVALICDAANSLMQLIENLLDSSKLSEGSLALSNEPFRIDELVREVLNMIQPAAREKGLALQCHIEAAVPIWLEGDRARIRQVLSNLVCNAVKFTERGTVHVRAAVDEEDGDSVAVRWVVTDTGVGISQDRQAEAFESFSQADGSITRRFGGMGLGLSLSKQLLDLMGGQIGFRSTADQGSNFWFTIPLQRHRLRGINAPQDVTIASRTVCWTNPAEAEAGEETRVPCRVLVAEDEYLNRVLIELLLSRAGCLVDVVGDGSEALGLLQRNVYDLMFMDLQMPKMNGLETIGRIRREEQEAGRGRHTRIIAVTAEAMPGDRDKCLAAGADDYLPKPFSAEALLEAVHRQIPDFLSESENRAVRRPDAPQADPPERLLSQCVAGLGDDLVQQDFQVLEHRARTLKDLAGRCGTPDVADSAMRIQLAARSRDVRRAAAALDRLRETLEHPPTQNTHHALCLCN
ncbi:MAG: response regulator [Rhodopirellula sp.]|nr:response regulator [Rhodopirellula sp.]